VENFILGLLAGGFLVGTIVLVILVSKMVATVTEILTIAKTTYIEINKIQQMTQATMEASENFVDALGAATKEFDSQNMHPRSMLQVFKTEDGRHSSPSFEGLIEKMKNDPTYSKMTEKDVEELRQLFEDNSDDDEEDDNENKEPWK
jgi:hypothetical protein